MEFTPSQVVAFNLRRARQRRGWTQQETVDRLERHLGERWSKTTLSTAERAAVTGRRVRRITADEIFAFAQTFNLPVTWFFMPPNTIDQDDDVWEGPGHAHVTTPTKQLSFIDTLQLLYPSDVSELVNELTDRAAVEIGLTVGGREVWHVVRQHIAQMIERLAPGATFAEGPPSIADQVKVLEGIHEIVLRIDALTTDTDREPEQSLPYEVVRADVSDGQDAQADEVRP